MSAPVAERSEAFRIVPLGLIAPSPTNVRRHMDPEGIDQLTESVRQHGILQPLLVRPAASTAPRPLELVCGHRRLRAAEAAGLAEVPVTVRQLEDREVLEIQMAENLKRQDLHPLDEAEGYERLHREYGRSIEEIALHFKISGQHVRNRLRLLELPPRARELLLSGALPLTTAALVARIPNAQLAAQAAKEIAATKDREALSIREASVHIRHRYMLRLDQAPFELSDGELHPEAGSCQSCPKRSGAQHGMFDDLARGNDDLCLDPHCHEAKVKAHGKRLLAQAKEQNRKILTREEVKDTFDDGGHTRYDSAFASPTAYTTVGSWSGVPRDVLGKDLPETAVAVNPKTGQTVELVSKKDLRKALKAKGLLAPRSSVAERADQDAEERAQAKRDAEAEVRRRLLVRVVARFETDPKLPVKMGRLLALALLGSGNGFLQYDSITAAARRRGYVEQQGKCASDARSTTYLEKWLREASEQEGAALVAEGVLVGAPDQLREVASLLDIDVTAVEAAVGAGEPDAPDPAGKPAPRKVSWSKPKGKGWGASAPYPSTRSAPKAKAAPKKAAKKKAAKKPARGRK